MKRLRWAVERSVLLCAILSLYGDGCSVNAKKLFEKTTHDIAFGDEKSQYLVGAGIYDM
jgi:hypothetical protein